MYCISVSDFSSWRENARWLVANKVKPESVQWTDGVQQSLFVPSVSLGDNNTDAPIFDVAKADMSKVNIPKVDMPKVSKGFIELAKMVACFDDVSHPIKKWQLLYSLLWRSVYQSKGTLALHSDPEVSAAYRMMKAVNRDRHKMKAFVRFKKSNDELELYQAWFEPEHFIVESLVSFFVGRFTGMSWSILTPKGCVHWDQKKVKLTPGMNNPQLDADQYDEFWKVYYCSIFNPARLKEKAMMSEMPKKYWKYLPEANCIKSLVTNSASMVTDMVETPLTEPERIRNQSSAVKKLQDELRAKNQV